MSTISLDASLRTCKVDTGDAQRIASDRFLNPNNMVCIPWNNVNSKGQEVCADSWYTKTPGCNSAQDRVMVENDQRPKYSDYITWNMAGIQGDFSGGNTNVKNRNSAATAHAKAANGAPNFGKSKSATTYQNCGLNAYERAMAEVSGSNRKEGYARSGCRSNSTRSRSGF
jgi:hypothetical protein